MNKDAEKLITAAIVTGAALGRQECPLTTTARQLLALTRKNDVYPIVAIMLIVEAMKTQEDILYNLLGKIVSCGDDNLKNTVISAAKKEPHSNAARLAKAANLNVHAESMH